MAVPFRGIRTIPPLKKKKCTSPIVKKRVKTRFNGYLTDACCDTSGCFWLKRFLNDGLDPKSSEFQSRVAIFSVAHVRHGGFVHRVALLFPSKVSFWVRYRELKL